MSKVFVLRPKAGSADGFEDFAHGCWAHVEPEDMAGLTVIDYATMDAAETQFLELLKGHPGDGVVVALCHGGPDVLEMPKDARFLGEAQCALLSNKFVYLVACSAAQILGPAAIREGATGFVGFVGEVWVWPSHRPALQQKAFMAGLREYLSTRSVEESARALRRALLKTADLVASESGNSMKDFEIIGFLTKCAKRVRSGVRPAEAAV